MSPWTLILIALAAWLALAFGSRAVLAWRLWRDRGLAYTWPRAWRRAGWQKQTERGWP